MKGTSFCVRTGRKAGSAIVSGTSGLSFPAGREGDAAQARGWAEGTVSEGRGNGALERLSLPS